MASSVAPRRVSEPLERALRSFRRGEHLVVAGRLEPAAVAEAAADDLEALTATA